MDKRIADFITEEVKSFESECGVSVISVHSGFHKVSFSDECKDFTKIACVKSELDFGM